MDLCSDPDSRAMQALKEELVSPGIAPASVPMLLEVDETDPMNGPFGLRSSRLPWGLTMFAQPLGWMA